jgi:hypothetical protein
LDHAFARAAVANHTRPEPAGPGGIDPKACEPSLPQRIAREQVFAVNAATGGNARPLVIGEA